VLASLGAMLAFACFGRVLSPQYLIWTAPLGVLAVAWRYDHLALAVAGATVLTLVEFPGLYENLAGREPLPVAIVWASELPSTPWRNIVSTPWLLMKLWPDMMTTGLPL